MGTEPPAVPGGSGQHAQLMLQAITVEGDAHRAALDGDWSTAQRCFRRAATLYRLSWEAAPPRSFGRLVGMLKAAILAGGAGAEAAFARNSLYQPEGTETTSPAEAYACALVALVEGEDEEAAEWTAAMREGSPPFGRAGAAIDALAGRDEEAFREAIEAIVRDFESRDAHLTEVPIADTALMFEVLAAARGLSSGVRSELLPGLPGEPAASG